MDKTIDKKEIRKATRKRALVWGGAAQGAGRGLTDGLLAPVRKGPEGGDGVQVRPGQKGRHGAVGHLSLIHI